MAHNPMLVVAVIVLGFAAVTFLVVWMLRAAPRPPLDSELSPDERRRRAENPAPPPTRTRFDQGNNSGL
ncbi:hypothetical protein C5B85_07230 [Pseudoclavibacter sp. AY1F1]|uniref:hypothetical protein n=1 Tax=Pseudoclavibacter sp. AY1F1 TaxID=2080583 RepID=UPI000CE739E1|nr:hypothetical protein [Pseudoclavibacter sp. AY1F1]PPF45365.1 hypothetical protein C5B85_07230 [Pseudoclavibacter sp. AY1F1]